MMRWVTDDDPRWRQSASAMAAMPLREWTRRLGALPTGRVEDWRAGRPFDRATFPVPATSHAACGFTALRAPICFTPRLMGPIPPGQLSIRRAALASCRTALECRAATAYSTAPSGSPFVPSLRQMASETSETLAEFRLIVLSCQVRRILKPHQHRSATTQTRMKEFID